MNDYSAHLPDPSPSDLAELLALARRLEEAQHAVARAEADLNVAERIAREIAEEQIPELMERLGVEEIPLTNGRRLVVQNKIRTHIPVARREEAYEWLEAHGHGGLVKRSVIVAFSRDQQEDARDLALRLGTEFSAVRTDQKVEPSTLTRFVRECLEAGEEIPLDLFGVYDQRVAHVKGAK